MAVRFAIITFKPAPESSAMLTDYNVKDMSIFPK